MEHMSINSFNNWAKDHILDDNRFDDEGFIIMENNKNYKSTGIIARIFEDNWDAYYSKYQSTINKIRPNSDKEVNKIINCFNHNLGASIYVCPKCDDVYFCHHTCKGRLCSSCGIKSQNIMTEHILQTCLNCPHRHITFTIPFDLTMWFFDDLFSTNILFDSVNDTLYSIVNGRVKKHIRKYNLKFSPGFFAFLHTFGRPLNFNPHIHVVIAEKILTKSGFLKNYNYFDYNALSKRFMKILLDKMEKYFGKSQFKITKNKMYLKYKNGFYVNNKLEDDGYKFNSIEELIKYVTRYCSRPVIAESRILDYDGESVTWCYTDHKTNEYHQIKESSFCFITRLLRHLLPSNFKSIRSYGFYNKPSKIKNEFIKIVKISSINFRNSLTKWSNSIYRSFKRIPISCPNCGILMELTFEVS